MVCDRRTDPALTQTQLAFETKRQGLPMPVPAANQWVTKAQLQLCRAVADVDDSERLAAGREFLKASGDDTAIQFAETNEVAPHLCHALMSDKSQPPPTKLQIAHDETHARISEYLGELDRVGDLLNNASIPMVALKNAGIARGLYPMPRLFPDG